MLGNNRFAASPATRYNFFFLSYILFIIVQYTIPASVVTIVVFYAFMLPAFIAYSYGKRSLIHTLLTSPKLRLYWIFFSYILIHALLFSDNAYILQKTFNHVLAVAIFFLASIVFFLKTPPDKLYRLFVYFVSLCVIAAILSIILYEAYYIHIDIRLDPISEGAYPTTGAMLYTIPALISIYLLTHTMQISKKSLFMLAFMIIFYMISLTQTRISIFLCLFLSGLWLLQYSKAKELMVLLLCLIIVPALVIYFNTYFHALFLQYSERLLARGMSFRLQLWQETIELIKQNPWIGYGLQAVLPTSENTGNLSTPHSIYLSTAYYLGIPAAFAFFSIIAITLYDAIRAFSVNNRQLTLALLLFVNALIIGYVDQSRIIRNAGAFWIIFWMPLAWVIACCIKEERKIDQSTW